MSYISMIKIYFPRIKILSLAFIFYSIVIFGQEIAFDIKKDLLLVQYDFKTDVDDLHTVAGFSTILKHPDYSELNYFAIAGTYGIQEGLYVPPNELMQLAFDNKWADAHTSIDKAIHEVLQKVELTLKNGGSVYVAEAGQSDFTAQWVKKLMEENPDINSIKKIHVVQHSDWNESVTESDYLDYVQNHTNYHKIPDGNVVGNGTPGFRSVQPVNWRDQIRDDELIAIWEAAIRLGNAHNGKEGRYLNEAIANSGLDFSDLSEVCYILNHKDIKDANAFFSTFAAN